MKFWGIFGGGLRAQVPPTLVSTVITAQLIAVDFFVLLITPLRKRTSPFPGVDGPIHSTCIPGPPPPAPPPPGGRSEGTVRSASLPPGRGPSSRTSGS